MPTRVTKLKPTTPPATQDRVASDFWLILRLRRRDLKLPQRKIAEKLGVSTATICHWELQWVKRLPMPGKFWALADALELTDQEMLEAAGYLAPAAGSPKRHRRLRVVK